MRGNVIGFDADTNTGAISGHDGQRYDFVTIEWRSSSRPHHGDLVDFATSGQHATQIYLVEPEYLSPTFGKFYFSPSARISRSQFWLRAILPIWGVWLVLYIIVISTVASGSSVAAGLFGILFGIYCLLMIWPAFVTTIKRMHDRNKSGWFIVLPLIPGILLSIVWIIAIASAVSSGVLSSNSDDPAALIGIIIGAGAFTWILILIYLAIAIWFFVEFGCLRGTIGPNRFGPDPVRDR